MAISASIALAGPLVAANQLDPVWLKQWTAAQRQQPDVIPSVGRIAPTAEPGTDLTVRGQVFEPDGTTPAADVVVFAYQTDQDGVYAPPGAPDPWRLKGWAQTDEDGRFELLTIRPGAYPSRAAAAHIHVTLQSATYGRQLGPSLLFEDDPLVSDRERRESEQAAPFGAVLAITRDADTGALTVHPRFRLKPEPDF